MKWSITILAAGVLVSAGLAAEGDSKADRQKLPKVELFGPYVGVGSESGRVVFTWEATGTGLQRRSVALSCAEKATGSWQVIVNHLENCSQYAWRRPPGTPAVLFMRIQVEKVDGTV